MKLESGQSAEDKRRWKIVRTDNFEDVAGEIVSADETTGECKMRVPNADRSGTDEQILNFGAGGFRIVSRHR